MKTRKYSAPGVKGLTALYGGYTQNCDTVSRSMHFFGSVDNKPMDLPLPRIIMYSYFCHGSYFISITNALRYPPTC